jgi:chemotaxis protein histidine kinase CheA
MTETKKNNAAAVSTFADHEVIMPPNKLKKAVVHVRPGTRIDFDPVARAEAALAELASEFSTWMDHECQRLDDARMVIRARGVDAGTRDTLFHAAHDIKGQAATFGFPLVAPVAESLCRLLEHTPDLTQIPTDLVDQHVDAIRAIKHRNTRGNSDMTAARLAERLRHVTEEFLVRENSDRPDYLEQILAPSITPSDAAG